MGRYKAAPTTATAGFVTLPKDSYELIIGEPKGFEAVRKINNVDTEVYGIRWPLTVAEGALKGKTVFAGGNESDEFGKALNKRILMAAEGLEITADNEELWNNAHAGDDYDFDGTSGVVGSGWLAAKGKRILADLDINVAKDGSGNQFQKFVRFAPVK